MKDITYKSQYLFKPYCLDDICYPSNVAKKAYKHIAISNDLEENNNEIPPRIDTNLTINDTGIVEYRFKVADEDLRELRKPKNVPTTLTLTKAKTDSYVSGRTTCPGLTRSQSNKHIRQQNDTVINMNKKEILLLRFNDDEYMAIDRKCPHKGGPLSQDDIENLANGDRGIRCRLHNFVFNLDNNGMKEQPATQCEGMRLPMYRTEVDEFGNLFICFREFNIDFN